MGQSSLLDKLAHGWADWMLPMSWQVALLVAVVLAITVTARKASAQFRYFLWCLVLIKLCLPPSLSFVAGIGQWLPVERPPVAEPVAPPVVSDGLPPAADVPMTGVPPVVADMGGAPLAAPAPLPELPKPGVLAQVGWPETLFLAWLVGMLVVAGLLVGQYLRMRRLLRAGSPVRDGVILGVLSEACGALDIRGEIQLFSSGGLSSPILFGLLRPRIILPAAALESLSHAQLKPIFLHELTHFRRRDLWVNWIQVVLQTVYWFHPLVWLANLRLRRERELIVDDTVLSHLGGERQTYGDSLMSILELAVRGSLLAPGYVGIVETKGGMAGRLRRILDARRKLSVRLGLLSAASLVVLGLVLIPQARSAGEPDKAPQDLPLTPEETAGNGGQGDSGATPSQKGVDTDGRSANAEEPPSAGWRESVLEEGFDGCLLRVWVSDLKPVYTLGKSIPLTVRIRARRNPEGTDRADRGAQLFPFLTVWVESESGLKIEQIALPIENRLHIKVGETFERRIDLARAQALKEPGTYEASVGHQNGLVKDIGDWLGTLRSRSQSVQVKGVASAPALPKEQHKRQEPALQEVQQELAARDARLNALVRKLRDADPEVRQEAVTEARRLNDQRVLGPLISALGDVSPDVGREAAHSVSAWGVQAIAPLLAHLLSKDARGRGMAAMALSWIRDIKAAEALVPLLDDADPAVRASAAWGIGRQSRGMRTNPMVSVVPKLAELLRDRDSRVCRCAATAIGQIGSYGSQPRDRSDWPRELIAAVGPLIQALGSPHCDVRLAAIQALGELRAPEGVAPLLALLDDRVPEVRSSICWSLAWVRDGQAVGPILARLGDPACEVRRAAAYVLGEMKAAHAVPGLIEAMRDEDRAVRIAAVSALGAIEDVRAIPPLIEELKTKRFDLREQAGLALARLGKPAIEPLIEILSAKSYDGSCHAALALGTMGGGAVSRLIDLARSDNAMTRRGVAIALGTAKDPRAVGSLTELLEDDGLEVRREAAHALAALGEPGVEALVKALGSEVPGLRADAAGALGQTKDQRTAGPLSKALADPHPAVRLSAARALVKTADTRAVAPLLGAMKAEASMTKESYAKYPSPDHHGGPELYQHFTIEAIGGALGKIGKPALPSVIDALSIKHPQARICLVRALSAMKDERTIEPLLGTLKDEDSNVRAEAVNALREFGAPKVDEALVNALDDPHFYVGEQAARAMNERRMRDPRAVQLALRLLVDRGSREAMRALGMSKDPAAVPALVQVLTDLEKVGRFWGAREDAAQALGRIGDARAVPSLIAALKDDIGAVRDAAAFALGAIGDRRAIEPLIAALGDQEAGCPAAAAEALWRFRDPGTVKPLVAAMNDPRLKPYARSRSVNALGKLGVLAKGAIPALEEVWSGTDSSLRSSAHGALWSIRAAIDAQGAATSDPRELPQKETEAKPKGRAEAPPTGHAVLAREQGSANAEGWRESILWEGFDGCLLRVWVSDLKPFSVVGETVPLTVRIQAQRNPKRAGKAREKVQLFPFLSVWIESDAGPRIERVPLPIKNRLWIKVGDTFERQIDLGPLKALRSPGAYRISVGHQNGDVSDIGDWLGTLRSREQAIHINAPDALPWGKEAQGLQAAVSVPKKSYRVGENVVFVVHLRNLKRVPVYVTTAGGFSRAFNKLRPKKLRLKVEADLLKGTHRIPSGGIASIPLKSIGCVGPSSYSSYIHFAPGQHTYQLSCRPVFLPKSGSFGAEICPDELLSRPFSFGVTEAPAGVHDDILDRARQRPPKQSRTGDDGKPVFPKYGHFEVDAAASALAEIPRPWTVKTMVRAYEREEDPKRKAHILWVLAASRDPRAAVILGPGLTDKALDVRVAATYGLMDFFMDRLVGGGTEQHMSAAQKWWKENRERLEIEARTSGERDTEPGTEPGAILLRGDAHFADEMYDTAREHYQTVIAAWPDSPESVEAEFRVCTALIAQKVFEKSEQRLRTLSESKTKSTSERAHAMLCALYFYMGEHERALEQKRKVLEMGGTGKDIDQCFSPLKAFDLGFYEKEVERYEDARELLKLDLGDSIQAFTEQLIRELESTPWKGPENLAVPMCWVFNFTEPMQKIIEVGPAAQDALIGSLGKRKIVSQVVVLLGAVGDEKAVPHIIQAMTDGPSFEPVNRCANLALTNITVADVIWHHGGGPPTPEPKDPKARWTKWWEANGKSFSVKDIKTSRRYSNYPNYGIYKVDDEGERKEPGRPRWSPDSRERNRTQVVAALSTDSSGELDSNMRRLQVPEFLPALAEVLGDPKVPERVRRRAATVLGGIEKREARDVLIEVLAKTKQPILMNGRELWSRVLDALARCVEREGEEELVRDLEHQNPHLRWLAASQLGKRKHAACVSRLIELLDDPHPDPRLGATWALGEIQGKRGIAELIAIVEKRRAGGNRVSAIEAMGKVGTSRAIEAIRSVKTDDPCYWKAEKTLKAITKEADD